MAFCPFFKEVWTTIWHYFQLPTIQQPSTRIDLKKWCTLMTDCNDGTLAKERAQIIVYTAWNIWKERCRREFDNVITQTSTQIAANAQLDIRSFCQVLEGRD
ncbi:hypothetical protein BS78_K328000 [Paspalum vaginatum]|uniref:Uncharacterized protein n=1 Tax=Paspalum vaginatum TaxID=158149 RepID=A0A9W8CDI2_9POAL|nr:hypothetical protein BS78_K328000 [Paspalum vaginatum]